MKKKGHKSKRSSSGNRKTESPVKILLDVILGVGSFLGTNFASNAIKGDSSIAESGFKVLIPQAAGIVSPMLKPQLKPVAIGSAISALMILMTQNPDKRSAMTDSKLLIAGEEDSESVDLSDLSQDQQEMLGKYLLGDKNSDPLGSGDVIMTGRDKVIMTGDVSDPLS